MAGLDPAIYGLKKTVSEIIPVRIQFKNQPDFPGARPVFDVAFPLNGRLNAVVPFRIHKAMEGIALGKAGNQSFAMFKDSPRQIGCHADIQRAIGPIGHDVNPASLHLKECMRIHLDRKDSVDGRIKSGHDVGF
jgi:hypothetical protein